MITALEENQAKSKSTAASGNSDCATNPNFKFKGQADPSIVVAASPELQLKGSNSRNARARRAK